MDLITYLSFALLVLVLFTVPGWLWLRRAGVDPLISLYAGPALSALAAAAVVALGVVLPWSVRSTCIGGAILIALATIACGVTAPRPLAPARPELAGMVVFAVAFLSTAAFSGVPSAPYGEWSQDTVGPARADSPRWPGLSIDNTLPFRTGQVSLYKQGGASIRDGYSVGWWLSDRTPLTGLDFAFAAGALGVHVSPLNIEQYPASQIPMKLSDVAGFWSYQVVAIFLNLTIILGVYLLARVWLSGRIAAIAALVAALMPGLFLNGIYTWPKEAIGYFVLVGAACALRRRPLLAGMCAALGYLTHPAGVFWIPALAILLLADGDLRGRRRAAAVRFLAPVVVLTAPWQFFTSQIMHATSRWTTAPLGYLMADPTKFADQLSLAWKAFEHNGVVFAIWVRIESTVGSAFPSDLGATPAYLPHAGGFGPQIMVSWSAAHGFSVWGMAGILLFPFTLVFVARHWSDFRAITLRLVVPALVLAELGNGLAYPFANQSMFALVGLVAIGAGAALAQASPRWRAAVVVGIAFELLTMAWVGLYRPFNISTASAVILTTIAALGQLGLLGALAGTLGMVPGHRWRHGDRRGAGDPRGDGGRRVSGRRWTRRLAVR